MALKRLNPCGHDSCFEQAELTCAHDCCRGSEVHERVDGNPCSCSQPRCKENACDHLCCVLPELTLTTHRDQLDNYWAQKWEKWDTDRVNKNLFVDVITEDNIDSFSTCHHDARKCLDGRCAHECCAGGTVLKYNPDNQCGSKCDNSSISSLECKHLCCHLSAGVSDDVLALCTLHWGTEDSSDEGEIDEEEDDTQDKGKSNAIVEALLMSAKQSQNMGAKKERLKYMRKKVEKEPPSGPGFLLMASDPLILVMRMMKAERLEVDGDFRVCHEALTAWDPSTIPSFEGVTFDDKMKKSQWLKGCAKAMEDLEDYNEEYELDNAGVLTSQPPEVTSKEWEAGFYGIQKAATHLNFMTGGTFQPTKLSYERVRAALEEDDRLEVDKVFSWMGKDKTAKKIFNWLASRQKEAKSSKAVGRVMAARPREAKPGPITQSVEAMVAKALADERAKAKTTDELKEKIRVMEVQLAKTGSSNGKQEKESSEVKGIKEQLAIMSATMDSMRSSKPALEAPTESRAEREIKSEVGSLRTMVAKMTSDREHRDTLDSRAAMRAERESLNIALAKIQEGINTANKQAGSITSNTQLAELTTRINMLSSTMTDQDSGGGDDSLGSLQSRLCAIEARGGQQPDAGRNDGEKRVCFQFRDTGKCSRKNNCTFVHGVKQENYNNAPPPASPGKRRWSAGPGSNNACVQPDVCKNWAKAGTCRFGDGCKWKDDHVLPPKPWPPLEFYEEVGGEKVFWCDLVVCQTGARHRLRDCSVSTSLPKTCLKCKSVNHRTKFCEPAQKN